jgi:hypothetical protein
MLLTALTPDGIDLLIFANVNLIAMTGIQGIKHT